MADNDDPTAVKFSVKGDKINTGLSDGLDTPGNGLPKSKSSSRFIVARVGFADEPHNEGDNRGDSPSPDQRGPGERGGVCFTLGDEGDAYKRPKPPDRVHSNDGSVSPPYSPNTGDTFHGSYDTHNAKTFGRNTLETLPNLDHYRDMMSVVGNMRKRPTLKELQQEEEEEEGDQLLQEIENGHLPESQKPTEEIKPSTIKFGWIKGVLVRCLLNIFGVMLFLRLSWVVGQAGMGLAAVIILLATLVTIITTLSMSAICTNGDVKGGGAYFMISRSLGPEFGGAIGIIFALANAVAIAMYVVGFAETIRDLLQQYDCLMVDAVNDVRIIGLITITVLLAIALIGMEWEARAQLILLAVLTLAIGNFIIGTFIPPSEVEKAKGFVGYRVDVVSENFGPDFRNGHNFFTVFAIFFPAATGILAGANISGDLENPSNAIPKGTILAVLITSITYLVMAWISGACILRDAGGPLLLDTFNITNGSMVVDELFDGYNGSDIDTFPVVHCTPGNCTYGLHNDMAVMQLASIYGPITIAGIISATLSSALASLVSAPKVFQAVCRDKIFPFIHVFAKGFGNSDEPHRAYGLAFVIGAACICIGDLNAIAPLISNFFLMSYALINYSCFDASLAKSPGWRPAFKYYSMWMSLLGAILCLGVMFIMNWYTALITFAFVAVLYTFVHYKKPDINWGSSTQAHVYRNALQHTLKLSHVLDHVKNFRPQLLVLSGFPRDRQILVDFASNITKNVSLMVCGHISKADPSEKLKDIRKSTKAAYAWLYKRKSKAFYCGVMAPNLRDGCQALLQCVGAGKLRPNTVLLGFKSDWNVANPQEVEDYYLMINDAFDLHYGVCVLRLQGGLDFSHHITDRRPSKDEVSQMSKGWSQTPSSEIRDWSPVTDTPKGQPEAEPEEDDEELPQNNDSDDEEAEEEFAEHHVSIEAPNHRNNSCYDGEIDKNILRDLNRFHRKQRSGTIDVWWMFDDGGLTILIPYLLKTRSYWHHCSLRVFMPGTKKQQLDKDQRQMAAMLSKFRIEYSSMEVVQELSKKPHKNNLEEFDRTMEGWILDEEGGETEDTHPWKISKAALAAQKTKTERHIRMRELMLEKSRNAALIVMTLPIPRKGLCTSGLYMAWMDTLTRDLPPIVLIRGNQDSVLTYYS